MDVHAQYMSTCAYTTPPQQQLASASFAVARIEAMQGGRTCETALECHQPANNGKGDKQGLQQGGSCRKGSDLIIVVLVPCELLCSVPCSIGESLADSNNE